MHTKLLDINSMNCIWSKKSCRTNYNTTVGFKRWQTHRSPLLNKAHWCRVQDKWLKTALHNEWASLKCSTCALLKVWRRIRGRITHSDSSTVQGPQWDRCGQLGPGLQTGGRRSEEEGSYIKKRLAGGIGRGGFRGKERRNRGAVQRCLPGGWLVFNWISHHD